MNDDSSSRLAAVLLAWVGEAAPGAQLPSTRALVSQHGVSPVTVQKALRTLVTRGLIESRPGVGTFVRPGRPVTPRDYGWQTAALGSPRSTIPSVPGALRGTPDGAIALHSGYPDVSLLPERLVRSAMGRAARSGAAFSRPPGAGFPELRAWFASELTAATSSAVAPPSANDVVVVPGSQSGLAAVFRSTVPPGGPLLMESPTYWGAILTAAQAGVRAVPVPSGPDGPDPDAVGRALDETGARAFYVQPNYANPTGAQWSADVATQVLDIVRERGCFLIEDDWAHDFGIDSSSEPLAAREDSGRVIYIRSLTKSISPSMRVAAVVARGPVRDRILADSAAESMYVSGILQAAALDVVSQPGWSTHRRGLRHQLRSRRDALVEGLREHAPAAHLEAVPPGGLNLWVRLPDGTDVDRVVRASEARDLLVASGREWFPAEPSGPYVRLNFAGPDPSRFAEAARVLGRAHASVHDSSRGQ